MSIKRERESFKRNRFDIEHEELVDWHYALRIIDRLLGQLELKLDFVGVKEKFLRVQNEQMNEFLIGMRDLTELE